MQAYGRTDTGRVRETNQDAFICGRLSEDALFVAGKPPLQQALCDALTECGFGGIFGVPAALSSSMGVTGARIIHGEMGI